MEILDAKSILNIPNDRIDRWYNRTYIYREGEVYSIAVPRESRLSLKPTIKESWLQTTFDVRDTRAEHRTIRTVRESVVPGCGIFPRQGYVNFGKLICAFAYKHGVRHVILAASNENFKFKFPELGRHMLDNYGWPLGGAPTHNTDQLFYYAYQEEPYPTFEECIDRVHNIKSLGQAWSTLFAVAPGYNPEGLDLLFKGTVIGTVGRNRNEIRLLPECREYAEQLNESLNR